MTNKQIAIVIGGSSGVGKAICNTLKNEYKVINMSRRKNNEVENIYCDVTQPEIIKNAFKELEQLYGIPYCMFYVSGFVEPQSIFEIDENMLQKTIEVNLLGSIRCTQTFVKLINKLYTEFKIIYIASTAGTRPSAGLSIYASAKSALINFGLSMSEELKSYNIKVYIVSLGRVATELRKKLAPNENPNLIMQPEECANSICELLYDKGLVDGQNIIIRKTIKNN